MGVGINYKFDGYLCDVVKSSLDEDIEERKKNNDQLWMKIVALCAASPYQVKDECGYDIEWADHVVDQVRMIRDEIENNEFFICHGNDIKETLREDPDSVEDSI